MRLIGNVETKQHAERISAFLMTRDISSHCELADEVWEVWIRDEDQIDQAKAHLERFRGDPEAAEYRQAIDVAQKIAREQEKKLQEAKSNYIQMTNDRWNAPITKVAPFTVALVAICVIVSLFMTNMGNDHDSAAFRALAFCSISEARAIEIIATESANPVEFRVGDVSYDNRLRFASLFRGEVWRGITPIFIHFGIFHLVFNMFWLVHFGRQIEYRFSSVWLAILIVLIAVLSNVAQCLAPEEWDGSAITNLGSHWTMLLGGMSGVVYGLFGYVWMKMTFDPKCGLNVSMINAAILVIWLVACMAPNFFIPNVANWAHGIGLLAGMVVGYFPKLLSDLGIGKPGK